MSACCPGLEGRAVHWGWAAVAMGCWSGWEIPALTVRMARASNPRGTAAMWVRDHLEGLFTDDDFGEWYPVDGRRGLSPARLALVSVLARRSVMLAASSSASESGPGGLQSSMSCQKVSSSTVRA